LKIIVKLISVIYISKFFLNYNFQEEFSKKSFISKLLFILKEKQKIMENKKLKFLYATRRGVTLSELLVAMAIASILASISLVYSGNQREIKALETAAREVSAAIREAQNYALTGKNAGPGCNSYTFSYTNSNYSVNNNCNINYTYTLKNGVTFSNSTLDSIHFSVPHGTVSGTGFNNNLKIIELSKNNKKIKVCVYLSGKIVETNIGGSCP